jgi:predicted NAD/FAD-dependent oxidoreductase
MGLDATGIRVGLSAPAPISRVPAWRESEEITRLLLEAAEPWIAGRVTDSQLHRWRYAKPITRNSPPYLFSQEPAASAIAGNAFGGPSLEGAFL